MLLQNVTIWAQYPGRRLGGSTASGTDGNGSRSILGINNNRQITPAVGGLTNTNSIPVGWQFGNGWFAPMKGGGAWQANLGQATGISGVGAFLASGELGKNGSATLSGSGTISSAVGSLILYAVSSIQGTGTVTAQVSATLELAASLLGQGDAEGVLGALQAIAAAASLSGNGTISAAMGALAGMALTMAGTGTATGSTLTAQGSMAADIKVTGDLLSTANIADSVWGALRTAMNNPGSMGEVANLILKILRNKTVTDPGTGKITVYDDDGISVLLEADIFEDAAGTTPYGGTGVERRERME